MKIATWNVNSIIARLPHVVRWLEAIRPDVLCMQETKCTDDKFPFEELSKIGYRASVFGQTFFGAGVAELLGSASEPSKLAALPPKGH